MISVFATLFVLTDPSLSSVISDPGTIWYESLPQCYQSNGALFALDYNIAGNLDRTGTANNEHPWRHTGGLDECRNVTFKRGFWIPPGSKVKVRRVNRRMHYRRGKRPTSQATTQTTWTYPVGSVFLELLMHEGKLFEVRSRRKGLDGWDTDQVFFDTPPQKYVMLDNCVDCHKDIGTDSVELDGSRDWYGPVRGGEPGGPIHWHPFDTTGLGGYGIPIRIRSSVRHFVEWEP